MWLKRLWRDQRGVVNTMDTILLATILVLGRLDGAGIANARMNTVEAFLKHPQLHARDRVRKVGSPNGPLMSFLPAITIPGVEPFMGDIPTVGQHNDEIRAEFGLSEKSRP